MASHLAPRAPSPGDRLGDRFELTRRLGAGGMGEVWAAQQVALGREVAVKLLTADAAARPEAAARFEQEARALSRVDHDHILRVLDFGNDPALGFYLVTELLSGRALAQVLDDERRLPAPRAARIVAQVLAGLSAAHRAAIVHRDLKPENVMLVEKGEEREFVKLLDFGIAKVLTGRRVDLTEAGVVYGTPAYLSPEQALARPIDHRSDLYACGVMLFRALTGALPFEADTPTALAVKHVTEPAPPLPPDAGPPALAQVVARSLAKEPSARYASAEEMRGALLAAIEGLPEAGAGAAGASEPPRGAMTAPMSAAVAPRLAPDQAAPSTTPLPEGDEPLGPVPTSISTPTSTSTSTSTSTPTPTPTPTRSAPDPGRALVPAVSGPISLSARAGTRALLAVRWELHGARASDTVAGRAAVTPAPSEPAAAQPAPAPATTDRAAERTRPGELARQVVEAFGCRISWSSDDGLLAEHAAPTDTLQCAAALHDRLAVEARGRGFSLEVRTAVSLGDVVRTGRSLFGEAVAHAELLVQAAAPGEALFTHAVYLSMTRSEVAWEEHPLRVPEAGPRVYRLRPLPNVPRPELPFGGAWLDRARAGSRRGIGAGLAGRLRPAAAGALGLVRRRPGVGAAVLVGALLLLGAGAELLVPDPPLVRIEALARDGKLAEARAELERWAQEDPDAIAPRLWRARLLLQGGTAAEAVAELRRLLEKHPAAADDPEVAHLVVRCLPQGGGAAVDLVRGVKTNAVEQALLDATQADEYELRYAAASYLEDTDLVARVDWVRYHEKNLREPDCKVQKRASTNIGNAGDDRAIPVLEEALEAGGDRKLCPQAADAAKATLARLKRRAEAAK